jgi:hypothetical protein
MPGKKTNSGRDGVRGVDAMSRKALDVVIMVWQHGTFSLGKHVRDLAPTGLGEISSCSRSTAASIPRFPSRIDQQRMAKENINMPIQDCSMPAIALEKCFRWIEAPKQRERSQLSLPFLP